MIRRSLKSYEHGGLKLQSKNLFLPILSSVMPHFSNLQHNNLAQSRDYKELVGSEKKNSLSMVPNY